jgi:hypothetical protein
MKNCMSSSELLAADLILESMQPADGTSVLAPRKPE